MNRCILGTLLLGLAVALSASKARAEQDQVQFFSDIHIPAGSTAHDTVCFFCSVNIEGKATGDVVVFFGSTNISGEAQHDVVDFFGSVSADDNTSIGHDLVVLFGGARLGENVHVGEDLVVMFGMLRSGDGVTVEGNRVVQPAWIFFVPLFLLTFVVVLIVREFRAYRRRVFLRNYPFPPRF